MRPFRLISASRIARLEERTAHATESWCKDWMPTPVLTLVRTRAAESAPSESGLLWFRSGEASGGPWLGISESSLCKLVGLLGSTSIEGPLPSSLRSWGELALASLLESSAGARGVLIAIAGLDRTLFQAGSGAVVAEVSVAGVPIFVVLDAVTVDSLAPGKAAQPAKGGLSRRGALLSETSVRLEACLIPTSIEVGDLSSLQVGDTLQLDHPTASPIFVFSEGGVELGRAHLGRRESSRAVRLSKGSDSKASHVKN